MYICISNLYVLPSENKVIIIIIIIINEYYYYYHKYWKVLQRPFLTLSQTTNFRLFQTERHCRRQLLI